MFLNLTHLENELAGSLSGGQKKLLELGRTMMVSNAKVVLLDEIGAGVNRRLLAEIGAGQDRLTAAQERVIERLKQVESNDALDETLHTLSAAIHMLTARVPKKAACSPHSARSPSKYH